MWGRWIYAVGGNPEAAVRNGIPVPAVLISVYVLCGLLAGVAALLTMGKGNAGSPMAGSLAELDAIAAVIIGGASFLGGRGRVLNAITGALMIAVHPQRAQPARHRSELAVHGHRRGDRGGRRARRPAGASRDAGSAACRR